MNKIITQNNKSIERRWINDIKSQPNFQQKETLVHDEAFNLPIVEISKNQKQSLKNLINGKTT